MSCTCRQASSRSSFCGDDISTFSLTKTCRPLVTCYGKQVQDPDSINDSSGTGHDDVGIWIPEFPPLRHSVQTSVASQRHSNEQCPLSGPCLYQQCTPRPPSYQRLHGSRALLTGSEIRSKRRHLINSQQGFNRFQCKHRRHTNSGSHTPFP